MKFLLVFFVVLVGFWIWRSNRANERLDERRSERESDKQVHGSTEDAVDMVGCDLCGLHCPRTDLVVGRKGVYCSQQHRNQAEA